MSSIKDVARLAGVSTATVSRTLAEPDKVTEATRRKVQTAIRRSGYVRNALARSFRMQSTQTILVLVPDIGNPFYSLIIQGLEEIAQRHHYRLLLGDTQNSVERELEYLQSVMQRQVDGVVSLGHTLPPVPSIKGGKPIPLVMACEYLHDTSVASVSIDNIAAATLATQHLLGLGHRRIAFINGPVSTPLSKDRMQGYRQALKASGVPYSKDLSVRGDFSLLSGEGAARALIASNVQFTAIVAANDAMAIGAIKVLRAQGRTVPDDVSVVGFDDIEFAQYVEPPLTTIRQPRREIGRATMTKMIKKLSDATDQASQIVLAHELIIRSSTAPHKGE
ncbi:MAG TPA: LacI family DNA-binding transcriptional regulator [Spongiibacteraceae bacterium]|nr:LacI family DNA-binding transcriptional regulator [Spongiibacteraceae bacterium]